MPVLPKLVLGFPIQRNLVPEHNLRAPNSHPANLLDYQDQDNRQRHLNIIVRHWVHQS